jgi:hypothetical protein
MNKMSVVVASAGVPPCQLVPVAQLTFDPFHV